jgi:hypothetical protein
MAPIQPSTVPRHFPAGTTVKYSRVLDEFAPSDGWSYTIYLNGLTQKFSKQGTPLDGASFLIEFLPADTESLTPGAYRYCERLTNPGTRFVLTGVVAVGGNGLYSFSGYTGMTPYVGMTVTVAGFANSGNNLTAVISAITGDGVNGGTFTLVNGGAINETHAGTGTGAQEVYDIRGDELVINIEPDAAASAAGSFQTFEEKTLAVLETVISGRVTADIEHYQIAGRAVTKIPIKELLELRGTYRALVWRQRHPGKLGVPYKVEFPLENEGHDYPPTWQDVTGLDR